MEKEENAEMPEMPAATALQNLTLETLDLVLMKVVLTDLSIWIQQKPIPSNFIAQIILPRLCVWSDWRWSLVSIWTKIRLKPRIELLTARLPCNPTFVPRSEWFGRNPAPYAKVPGPVQKVIVHHSVEPADPNNAFDDEGCLKAVRKIQSIHMDTHSFLDVGYNFLVGDDGRVYVGRGWKVVGAHTLHFNEVSVGICVIGNFQNRSPTDAALKAMQELIRLGVNEGHIDPDYTLHGHRDLRARSLNPGDCLYRIIKAWEHYESAHFSDNV